MKIYTSYFYKVRFFEPHFLGFSTCMSDPKWFHDFRRPPYTFIDKRGVLNGLRADPFVPGESCEGLCYGPQNCSTELGNCAFLDQYYKQLCSLDKDAIVNRFITLGQSIKFNLNFKEEPVFILLVHEAPTNPCSERWPLQKWLTENDLFAGELK